MSEVDKDAYTQGKRIKNFELRILNAPQSLHRHIFLCDSVVVWK